VNDYDFCTNGPKSDEIIPCFDFFISSEVAIAVNHLLLGIGTMGRFNSFKILGTESLN
jgi:hypothetical protein